MDDWTSPVEQAIRDMIERGEFDDLPGAGKPLKLDEDETTPRHLRMAYKLLKDNDLEPEWIMAEREIDEKRTHLRNEVKRGWRAYRGAVADAERADDRERRDSVERAWRQVEGTLQQAAEKFNKAVLNFNIKVPKAIGQKTYFDLQAEIDRLR